MWWALTGSDEDTAGGSTNESRGLVGVTDVSDEVMASSCPGNKNCGGSYMETGHTGYHGNMLTSCLPVLV